MARRRVTGLVVVAVAAGFVPQVSAAPGPYRRVSASTFQPSETAVSGNGRYVAFTAYQRPWGLGLANGAVPPPAPPVPGHAKSSDDQRQIYLTDLKTGRTELVSTSVRGTPGNWDSTSPSISADGRYVVFSSLADNLVRGDTNTLGDTSGAGTFIWGWDIFVRDRKLGRTTRVSLDPKGREIWSANNIFPAISADGSTIAYYTQNIPTFVPSAKFSSDLLLVAVPRGKPSQVSVAGWRPDGTLIRLYLPHHFAGPPAISANGRYVASMMDGAGGHRAYVRDMKTRRTTVLAATPPFVTEAAGWGGEGGARQVFGRMTMDAAGTKLLFEERLLVNPFGAYADRRRAVLWNFRTGTALQADGAVTTVTDPTGVVGTKSDPVLAHVTEPVLSADGRYLVFTRSDPRALSPLGVDPYTGSSAVFNREEGPRRVIKRDLATGQDTELVTCELPAEAAQLCADRWSYAPSISADGSVVAFVTSGALDDTDPDAATKANTDPNRLRNPDDVYVVS